MSSFSILSGLKNTVPVGTMLARTESCDRYDVVISFLAADDLPKLDIVGYVDPYFIAKIDDQLTFTSSILSNTSAPKWNNEKWIVRNIPINAKLSVVLFDRDDDKLIDDYIGQFEILNLINYHAPVGGHRIIDLFGNHHGSFHLSIQSIKSSEEMQQLPSYTFDGPCRYSRHDSVAIGRLTMLNVDCIYSTWKIQMKRISVFFPPYERQHWNKQHKPAQKIFDESPLSVAAQTAIRLGHKVLYGKTLKHNEYGQINNADDVWNIIFLDRKTNKIKPSIYTYVIDDNTWRFSETGNQFFIDFASKHALLANGSKSVRYAGEFHPRPKYGWDRIDDEWELVFDNGSGTYAPAADLLLNLKELLLFNFPGLNVVTYDYNDPRLKESVEQSKSIAKKLNQSIETIGELAKHHPLSN